MRQWQKSRNTSENKETVNRLRAFHKEDRMKQLALLGISLGIVSLPVAEA